MRTGRFNIIMGAQAGSEAKGKLSAFLVDKYDINTFFTTASPNAGHTVVKDGKKYVSYHLPIGAVINEAPIIFGPASVINPAILKREMEELNIPRGRVTIDPRASVITEEQIQAEKDACLSDIGSTLQGIGETRIRKIRRDGSIKLAWDEKSFIGMLHPEPTSVTVNKKLKKGYTILGEMTQGFDLDLEHGIDPRYCTSKMINPSMALAEAGVTPRLIGHIYGVLRPFPIRVNNRTGTSGPYTGSTELQWSSIAKSCGHPTPEDMGEITTTTKLPRRVFSFSWNRYDHFITVVKPDYLCLQFANYLCWNSFGKTNWFDLDREVQTFTELLEKRADGARVAYIGTGPEHAQMVDRNLDGQM